jgi:hypothetical protein
MSQNFLHVVSGTRSNCTSVLVGDRAALCRLGVAIEQALRSGSGGTSLFSSDGEPHRVAIVLEDDMYPVYTTYANEPAPARSRREAVSVDQLRNYADALDKAFAASEFAEAEEPARPASVVC